MRNVIAMNVKSYPRILRGTIYPESPPKSREKKPFERSLLNIKTRTDDCKIRYYITNQRRFSRLGT